MKSAVFGAILIFAILSAGTVFPREYRVLAIRVDFPFENPDHETTTGRGKFDLRDYTTDSEVRAQYANPWDIPPHDGRYFENHLKALGNYWSTVSEGRVSLSFRVLPDDPRGAYTLSKTFYKYGNGRTKEQTSLKLAELFREAIETCRNAEGGRVRFSDYDTFVIIHAGVGQETSGGLNDIPSAYLDAADFKKYLGDGFTIDGFEFTNGLIVPEAASENGIAGLNGILAQMFGHRLGLPSLSNTKDGLPAAGGWALMDTGGMAYGRNTRGFVPTLPCAWSRIELGWNEPVVVTSDTTLSVAAAHVANGLPRAVKIPVTADEYLLIENRERYALRDSLPKVEFSSGDSSGVWMKVDHYDAFIPGSGILVWRVNERIIRERRTAGTINDDSSRRGIDLLEADGRQDIGAPFGFGDPRAEYSEGRDEDAFWKGGRDTLSPSGDPNSGSMWGANSGISVTVDSPPGDVMSVTIRFSPRTDRLMAPGGPGRLTAADLDDDGADELIASGADSAAVIVPATGRVLAFPASGHPAVAAGTPKGALLAVPGRDGVTLSRFTGGKLETVETVSAELPDGTGGIPEGPVAAADGRLVFAVRAASGAGRFLCAVSTYTLPVAGREFIAIGDTAGTVSIAIAGDFFAAAAGKTLFTGRVSTNKIESYPLPTGEVRGPVIADLDRNGAYEVILTVGASLLIAENALPALTAGAPPNPIRFRAAALDAVPVGEPAAADVDLDGFPEILVSAGGKCRAFRAGGIIADGFPLAPSPGDSSERITTQPIVADFGGDGIQKPAFATSNMRFSALSGPREPVSGFPVSLRGPASDTPAVFTLTAAGKNALAWRSEDGSVFIRTIGSSGGAKTAAWPMWRGGAGLSGALPNERIPSTVKTAAAFQAFCYPNPVTGATGAFRIVPAGRTGIRVAMYSVGGEKVFETALAGDSVIPGAPNEVRFDASRFSSGLYLARITAGSDTKILKVGVLR